MSIVSIKVNGVNFSIFDEMIIEGVGFYFIFECAEDRLKDIDDVIKNEFYRRVKNNEGLFVNLDSTRNKYLIIVSVSNIEAGKAEVSDGFSLYKMSTLEKLAVKLKVIIRSLLPYSNKYINV